MNKLFIMIVLAISFTVMSAYPCMADSAVFVSRWDSRPPPFSHIYDYYTKLRDKFSTVTIVKDTEVTSNTNKWKTAYENSELVFVIDVSDEVLTTQRNKFCKNLDDVLKDMKGIIFAGNSALYSSDEKFGCPYTDYFNFSYPSINTYLTNDKVMIFKEHLITEGYDIYEDYNLEIEDSIYTINFPRGNYDILAVVSGPALPTTTTTTIPPGPPFPPQSGSILDLGYYPAITIWEGITYRGIVWSLNTSKIDCNDCLGWKVFYQALDWVSDVEEMGIKMMTNKEIYTQGDIIEVNVSANANITEVDGVITFPDGRTETVYFTGSGKLWKGFFTLLSEDPDGNYRIDVNADDVHVSKNVTVRSFYLTINVKEEVKNKAMIRINVINQSNGYYKNVNVTVKITDPKGMNSTYTTKDNSIVNYNNGTFSLFFNLIRTGKYIIFANATDSFGRSSTETQEFMFYPEMNVKFFPENFTKKVSGPQKIKSQKVKITNKGSENLTNINLIGKGDIASWIELYNTSLPEIEPNKFDYFYFNITIPDNTPEGEYTGSIEISTNMGVKEFQITITVEYTGTLSVSPKSWTETIKKGMDISKEFTLANNGKGTVNIISIETSDSIEQFIEFDQKPTFINPDSSTKLKVKIKSSGVYISDLSLSKSGTIDIKTNYNNESIRVMFTIVKDLSNEADSLISDLQKVESKTDRLSGATDVSSIKDKINDLRSLLDEVKSLYSQGEYDDALTKLNSAMMSLDKIDSEVTQLEEQVKQEQQNRIKKITTTVVGTIVLVIVGWIVATKVIPKRKYDWLYKKWGHRRQIEKFTYFISTEQ